MCENDINLKGLGLQEENLNGVFNQAVKEVLC